jgi:hypothetical protein
VTDTKKKRGAEELVELKAQLKQAKAELNRIKSSPVYPSRILASVA